MSCCFNINRLRLPWTSEQWLISWMTEQQDQLLLSCVCRSVWSVWLLLRSPGSTKSNDRRKKTLTEALQRGRTATGILRLQILMTNKISLWEPWSWSWRRTPKEVKRFSLILLRINKQLIVDQTEWDELWSRCEFNTSVVYLRLSQWTGAELPHINTSWTELQLHVQYPEHNVKRLFLYYRDLFLLDN